MRVWMVVAVVACGESSMSNNDGSVGIDGLAGPSWNSPALVTELAASGAHQQGAVVRDDGLEVIFASERSSSSLPSCTMNGNFCTTDASCCSGYCFDNQLCTSGCARLWRATRATTTDAFGTPTQMPALDGTCASSCALSPDGLELLFAGYSRDPLDPGAKMFRATRSSVTSPFGAPTEATELNVGPFVDSPSLSADGRLLVFQVGNPENGLAIYQAERGSPTGAFDVPRQLTELPASPVGVAIAPDALFLLAYSDASKRFRVYSRTSTSSAFGGGTVVPIPFPNPAYNSLSTPFIARGTGDLYYSRLDDNATQEIWRAIRRE